MNTNKKALVLLFDQCEECELIIPVDSLRRAGITVTIASVEGSMQPVTCHKGVKIMPDVDLKEIENQLFDCVIVPGGPGYERLEKVLNFFLYYKNFI
jgi:putative intracellular protease/amidase